MLLTLDKFESMLTDLVSMPLTKALAKHGVSPYVFLKTVEGNAELTRRYALVMRFQADVFAGETIDIADTEIDPNRARVRIQARQWAASKLYPTRYGDRLDVNVQTVDINAALNEARTRRERLLHPRFIDKQATPQLPELTEQKDSQATDNQSVATLDEILS